MADTPLLTTPKHDAVQRMPVLPVMTNGGAKDIRPVLCFFDSLIQVNMQQTI